MPPIDRVLPALGLAATLVGMAGTMLAQAVFDPFAAAAERIIGGSIIMVAAILIVRWTFRLWQETRETAAADREAAMERERLYLQQISDLNNQLIAERQLRISLERVGLIDRREPDDPEDPENPPI